MPGTRNTMTVLEAPGGMNRTGTHVSTNIVIVVSGNTVGAVQDLTINEKRPNIAMIDEVGTDGHIDSVPSKSTNVSGSCKRTRYDKMRIGEAFSRGFTHVKSQRIPFDIEIHDFFHDSDKANQIITVIKNVWIDGIDYSYKSDDFVIIDNMSWQAEDIFSVMKTNQNIVQAGISNGYAFPVNINPIEQDADRGDFRGSLDSAGLLLAYDGGGY